MKFQQIEPQLYFALEAFRNLALGPLLYFLHATQGTVKPQYNDNSLDPKLVAVVERRSLFKMGSHKSGLYRQVVTIRRW